nr:translationally-controlled tumor protein-like [Equus asinus]
MFWRGHGSALRGDRGRPEGQPQLQRGGEAGCGALGEQDPGIPKAWATLRRRAGLGKNRVTARLLLSFEFIMSHHLQETSFTKEAYKKYNQDSVKSIKGKLEEQRPERVKPFVTGAAEPMKPILANFKNCQFFAGENMNPDGMAALLDCCVDGVTPYMIFLKDGLEMEKC